MADYDDERVRDLDAGIESALAGSAQALSEAVAGANAIRQEPLYAHGNPTYAYLSGEPTGNEEVDAILRQLGAEADALDVTRIPGYIDAVVQAGSARGLLMPDRRQLVLEARVERDRLRQLAQVEAADTALKVVTGYNQMVLLTGTTAVAGEMGLDESLAERQAELLARLREHFPGEHAPANVRITFARPASVYITRPGGIPQDMRPLGDLTVPDTAAGIEYYTIAARPDQIVPLIIPEQPNVTALGRRPIFEIMPFGDDEYLGFDNPDHLLVDFRDVRAIEVVR